MMKLTIRLLSLMLVTLTFAGCRNDVPLIGDLAGQWQIQEIAYPDGTVVSYPQRYYCFYRHTAQLTAPGNVKETANMIYDNPDLSLEFPNVSPLWLSSWGVSAPEGADETTRGWVQRYHIDRLDRSHLVMTTEQGTTITMRKY